MVLGRFAVTQSRLIRCDGSASSREEIRCADTRTSRHPRGRRCRWTRCSHHPRLHARLTISRWKLVHCRESNDFPNKRTNEREPVARRRYRLATEARTASRGLRRYSCSSNPRVAYKSAKIIPCICSRQIIGFVSSVNGSSIKNGSTTWYSYLSD